MKTNRKIIFALLAAGLAAGGVQAAKTDLVGRARLRGAQLGLSIEGKQGKAKVKRTQAAAAAKQAQTLRGFLTLAPGFTAADVEALGWITVTGGRSRVLTVEFPADRLEDLEKTEAVKRFQLERQVGAKMDRARLLSNIDAVHAGTGLPQGYTGKGVICGTVDGGFDPNHINFKNADGSSRIQRFIYFRPTEEGDLVKEVYNSEYIPNIDTETEETFHGTHTLGIMAGSYRGPVKTSSFDGSTVSITERDNPYYGVAYESDLAVASGAPTDYYVAQSIETLLDYAYSKDKPLVVNLSLGTNLGPHDGTSQICEYLDETAENDRVVFCVAAGNEGSLPISISKTFAEGDMQLKSMFWRNNMMEEFPNFRYGQTCIYSDTDTGFELQVLVINRRTQAVKLRLALPESEGEEKYICTGQEWGVSGDILSPTLGEYFNGYVGVAGAHEEPSGRYMAMIDIALFDKLEGANFNGDYDIAFQITAKKPGQRIDVYGDGQMTYFTSNGLAGYTDGQTDGTISDIATGRKYVVVGAYNNRDKWGSLDGEVYCYDPEYPDNEIASYSSYGSLIDGRTLPHVCAPGTGVISSTNEYYMQSAGTDLSDRQGYVTADGRPNSWFQCMGTSMATPVVTGSIALWMQANPNIDYSDVLDIISRTSRTDEFVQTTGCPAQWGAGKFDAYEGLKEVLKLPSAVKGIESAKRPMVRHTGNALYEICLPGQHAVSATIYNAQGAAVARLASDNDTLTADLSAMAPGVYFIKTAGSAETIRIVR